MILAARGLVCVWDLEVGRFPLSKKRDILIQYIPLSKISCSGIILLLFRQHWSAFYSRIKFTLTALVELVDAGDVIGTHHLGGPDDAVRVVLCNDGRLAVVGEGVSGSRHRRAVENNLVVQAQTLCGSSAVMKNRAPV